MFELFPETQPCKYLKSNGELDKEKLNIKFENVSDPVEGAILSSNPRLNYVKPDFVTIWRDTNQKYKTDIITIRDHDVLCQLSICPFKLLLTKNDNKLYFGSECSLDLKEFNNLIGKLLETEVLDKIDNETLEYIYSILKNIVNQYNIIQRNENVLNYDGVPQFYKNIISEFLVGNLTNGTINLISEVIYNIKKLQKEYIEEKYEILTSPDVEKIRLENIKTFVETGEYDERIQSIKNILRKLDEEYLSRTDEIFRILWEQLIELGYIEDEDDDILYEDFKETIVKIVNLYYFFKVYHDIKYDEGMYVW